MEGLEFELRLRALQCTGGLGEMRVGAWGLVRKSLF